MAIIEWTEDSKFIAISRASHGLVIDGDSKIGAAPMELVLIGVASCTGSDVVAILKKMRADLKGLKVYIEGERAEEYPKVYTRIKLKYTAKGNIDEKDLKKAIDLSQEKYCSASIMLKRSGTIFDIEYEIEP
ncbi:MAG: OsmC family protein [Thermoplasmata archaeon]